VVRNLTYCRLAGHVSRLIFINHDLTKSVYRDYAAGPPSLAMSLLSQLEFIRLFTEVVFAVALGLLLLDGSMSRK
jgi:hypothetical protein